MSEPQGEYRIQPLVRLAKVYRFPTLSKWEIEELTQDEIRAREEDRALQALRAKARLEANTPLPWYKRITAWYDRNYMAVFEGTGTAIAFLAGLSLLLVVFMNLGRSVGWWSI